MARLNSTKNISQRTIIIETLLLLVLLTDFHAALANAVMVKRFDFDDRTLGGLVSNASGTIVGYGFTSLGSGNYALSTPDSGKAECPDDNYMYRPGSWPYDEYYHVVKVRFLDFSTKTGGAAGTKWFYPSWGKDTNYFAMAFQGASLSSLFISSQGKSVVHSQHCKDFPAYIGFRNAHINAFDGNWHIWENYIKFSTGRFAVFVDGHKIVDYTLQDHCDCWNAGTCNWMAGGISDIKQFPFPSISDHACTDQSGSHVIYRREIDVMEWWNTEPFGGMGHYDPSGGLHGEYRQGR